MELGYFVKRIDEVDKESRVIQILRLKIWSVGMELLAIKSLASLEVCELV